MMWNGLREESGEWKFVWDVCGVVEDGGWKKEERKDSKNEK